MNKFHIKQSYWEWIVQGGFWLIYFFYPILQYGDHPNFSFDYEKGITNLIFEVLVVYVVYLWALPHFLKSDKFKKRIMIVMGITTIILGASFFNCKINHYVMQCNCSLKTCIFNFWLRYLSLIGIFTAFYLFKKYQETAKQIEITKKEKHLSELKALKAQIHPHFMLNTLNAIYSHAVIEDTSPKLSKLIFQFSDTLKYVVYEGQQKYVSLDRELSHIENFIRLQEFRLEDKVEVHFKEDISNKGLSLPPVLLINFIENAFKHTTELRGQQHKIEIRLEEKEGILDFFCQNPLGISNKQISSQQGVGLENTLKRLELLYPKQHKINIDKSNGHFTVHLKIDLK